MRRTVARRALWALALVAAAGAGCDSSTASEDPEIAIALSSNSATVAQGDSTPLTVTIGRTNFKDPVTLTALGLPAGVTAKFTPTVVPNGIITSEIWLSATGSSIPVTATVTIRATGAGITDQTATLELTVLVRGSYTLSALRPSVTVAQEGAGSTSILINRVDLYAGEVSLTVSGAPAGVSATLTPTPTTGNSSTLVLSAAAGAATGTYPLTITSDSPGLSQQSTQVSVVVIAPPSTTSISVPACSGFLTSTWAAFQNEGYGWKQVTVSGNSFTFAATEKLGFAHVVTVENQSHLDVYYLTRAELSNFSDRDCAGTKSLNGSVAGLASGQSAFVGMGNSLAVSQASTSLGFTLSELATSPLDLVASRGFITSNRQQYTPDKVIVRRGVDLPSGSTIPALDFNSDGFAPATSNLTVTGALTGENIYVLSRVGTATSTHGVLQVTLPTTGSLTLYTVPAAELATSDLHELYVDAFGFGGYPGHGLLSYFAATSDRTELLGPALSTATVTSLTTTPHVRLRGQLPSQSEYASGTRFIFRQQTISATRFIYVTTTAAYLDGTPATWDVAIPHFGAVEGLNSNWLLASGQSDWYVEALSGRIEVGFLGAPPASGDVVKFAYRIGGLTSLRQFRADSPFGSGHSRRSQLRQYLRR